MTMTQNEVVSKINSLFVDLFEVEPEKLKPEVLIFEDLGLDSLDAIDLVISFEKHFKFSPPQEELKKLRTLNDVYTLVNVHLPSANSH